MKVVQEGSINSLMKYTKSVSTMKHKKRAQFRRFGSTEDPPESPLTRKHKEFYRQTFQEFSNLIPMSRTFTHQKPNSKAAQLDKL
jgi:predicted nucleotidyltransferase